MGAVFGVTITGVASSQGWIYAKKHTLLHSEVDINLPIISYRNLLLFRS